MHGNEILTSYGLVREDLARISNGPKSADFEQNPGLYPMVLNMADSGKFWSSPQTP